MSATAKPRRHVRATALGLALAASLILSASALASEPTAPAGGTETPSGSGSPTCPASNPPNTLELVAGTPQTATLGVPFATALQVALANSDGCPVTTAVAGIPVTFAAPAVGSSGLFAASAASTATVGSDASGAATAPTFTADDTAGSYTVTASSAYGSVRFSLANAVATGGASACSTPAGLAGAPAKIIAGVGAVQSARVGASFPIRLAVTVTDAEKHPVPGALVTFSAPVRGPSGRFATRSRRSRRRSVEVQTNACGIALAPAFIANGEQGGYIVKASVERVRPAAFALVNAGPGQRP
jgi:hypothetical protein